MNGIIRKLKYHFPQKILLLKYSSLIESHINYCILLWGTNIEHILKLQKSTMRNISLLSFRSHTTTSPIFKTLGILRVEFNCIN